MKRFEKTKFYTAENSYQWVRSIGQYWKIRAIDVLMWCVVLDVLFFVVSFLFFLGSSFVGYLFFLFFVSLLILFSMAELLKHSITCRVCGYRPSKSKKTGKAISALLVDDRLLKLEQCPDCWFQNSQKVNELEESRTDEADVSQ